MEVFGEITHTCCVLGHREILETEALRTQVSETLEELIVDKGVQIFLFGSKSQFNSLCYELVTEMKEKYPHIHRIYVRGEFPVIDEGYYRYLLERYEDTCYPQALVGTGRAVYIKRNQIMVDNSQFCLVYYRGDYAPKGRKSGTKLALEYARKQNRTIYCCP